MRALLLIALVAALTLAACGTDEPDAEIPGGADPAEAGVIEEWSKRLRDGDVEGAAELFAIPSVAENGPTLLQIESLADAELFNASLPCGAELLSAAPEGDFVVAAFRLTERPGPGSCGTGTGTTAETAFVIEDGEIVEWRRVDTGGEPAPGSSV